jgi:hypothetical protein
MVLAIPRENTLSFFTQDLYLLNNRWAVFDRPFP